MPELRNPSNAGQPLGFDGTRGDPADIVIGLTPGVVILERLRELVPEWWADAACAGHPLEWWFPPLGANGEAGKAICRDCLTREECLAEAIADPTLDHGIRGGLNAKERKQLRRELKTRQGGATDATA